MHLEVHILGRTIADVEIFGTLNLFRFGASIEHECQNYERYDNVDHP
jgi:hypothetical protein